MPTEIIYVDAGPGYNPVFHMARLAAELFDAEFLVLRQRSLRPIEKLFGLLPRSRSGLNGILICPAPFDLTAILSVRDWRKRYGQLVAWTFNSFWPEYLSRLIRVGRIFDHIFVTEVEDIDTWRRMQHAPVDWLPWGSDVLRLGSANPQRPLDLTRFGRQPAEWERDDLTAVICASMQLHFQGRPPPLKDPSESQKVLMQILAQTKFSLSFSNLVSPGVQTHLRRAYITARWTDALSAGATVAGVPPRSETVQALLWDDALLDIGTVDQNTGLEVIAHAVRCWTPQRATLNYSRSLGRLDWRWRFERLANALDIHPHKLDTELALLRQKINDCGHTKNTSTMST